MPLLAPSPTLLIALPGLKLPSPSVCLIFISVPHLLISPTPGVMSDLQGVNTANSLLSSDDTPTSLAYDYFG
jgi:hypothetical protein